jgi:hypothetical protein
MGNAANVLVGVALLEIGYPVGAAYTAVGYTADGVSVEYNVTTQDVEVDEKTFPILRTITKETVKIVANLAESSLYNIDKSIAGTVLAGSIITFGGGIIKTMSVRVTGKDPAGNARTLVFSNCTASANVSMKYTKAGKTIVPVSFSALDGTNTLTDS